MSKGLFIAFEGIDGSGKTTQITYLQEHLHSLDRQVLTTNEPSAGPVGSLLRQFLTKRIAGDKRMIAALFAADRLDHITNETNGLLKYINAGTDVITDRYCFSSYAYNSVDIDPEWVISANSESMKLLCPDMVIFIDIPVDVALSRIANNRFETELYEERERLEQVRTNYFKCFERFSGVANIRIIDGTKSIEEIAADIRAAVDEYIAAR